MKHSFVLLLIAALMFGGCSKEQTPEELAGQAAKTYYDRLLADDYEGFLRGKVTSDSLPDDYRAQLLTSYKQYKQNFKYAQRQHHADDAGIPVASFQGFYKRRDYCADGA